MLKKLLKYDLRAIFKFWWIAAAVTLLMSAVVGVCISVMNSPREFPVIINVVAVMTIVISVIGLFALPIVTFILIFSRFYKNFFTDEGYLTFTLPVTKGQLLFSKIITGTLSFFSVGIVIIIDLVVMFWIPFPEEFGQEFLKGLAQVFANLFEELGFYGAVYVLEFLVIGILSIVFAVLFLYNCITLGSIVTKKAKVITSVAIYYFSNGLFTTVLQIFFSFGLQNIVDKMEEISYHSAMLLGVLILFVIILFMAILCMILYTVQYWMLDRKLNLS